MATSVNTSVSLEFKTGDTEDGGPPAIVLETDDLKAPYGFAFARLFYVGAKPTLLSTAGYSVYTVSTDVTSDEIDFISFQGKDSASLSTPGASNVSVTPLGKMIDMSGKTLSGVAITVDAVRGTLKSAVPFYGTLQVTYNSRFQRLQTQFREIPGVKDNPLYPSMFSPLVLIARQGAGEAVSLELQPPNKDEDPANKDLNGYGAEDKSTGEVILIELDGAFPVSIGHNGNNIPGLTAIARLLVYSSHGGLSYVVSNGAAQGDTYGITKTIAIKETVNFVGAQSASTRYPPANGVSVRATGTLVSKATPGGIFTFVTAPHDVALGEWHGSGFYSVVGMRTVASNEIVATTSGVTVPISGQVEASYSTMREAVTVAWTRGGEEWFPSVVLTATDIRGTSESFVISPPERRGR